MIFTTASMLNRCGTVSTSGVGVTNHRIKKRRASHKMYTTLRDLTNLNPRKGPISETFNINNSDSWYVSYPDDSLNNFTVTLNNGVWYDGSGMYTLKNIPNGSVYDIFFYFPPTQDIKQTIQSIDDRTNSITWVLNVELPGYSTIVWTRL
jgi:hypothetical protein|tara:strand:+ start:2589 stop:3038 length:450 start_codon:yes stop_codon:yes gene_type:complete